MLFKDSFNNFYILFILTLRFIKQANASCATFEFQCLDGRCIPKSWLCDGTPDCQSQEDETHYHCDRHNDANSTCFGNQPDCMHQGHFRCIRHEWLCDGHRDCDDGQDELNCSSLVAGRGSCGIAEFSCVSGGCIPRDQICNSNFDCMDGSDEAEAVCERNRKITTNRIADGSEPEDKNSTNSSIDNQKASKTTPPSSTTIELLKTKSTENNLATTTLPPAPLPKTTQNVPKFLKIEDRYVTTTNSIIPTAKTTTVSPFQWFENPLFSLFGVTPRPGIAATLGTTPPTKRSSTHRAIVFKVAENASRTNQQSNIEHPTKDLNSGTGTPPPSISNVTLFPLLKPLDNIIVGVIGAKRKQSVAKKPTSEIRRAPVKDSVNTVHDYEMMETTAVNVSEPNGTVSVSQLENINAITNEKEFRTNRAKIFRSTSSDAIEDADMLNQSSLPDYTNYTAQSAARPVRYVKGVPIKPYKIRYQVKSLEKVNQD